MEPHEASGIVAERCADRRDRELRGVRSEQRVGWGVGHDRGKHLALELEDLGHGLDDDIRIGDRTRQIARVGNSAGNRRHVGLGDRPFLREPAKAPCDRGASAAHAAPPRRRDLPPRRRP